jgi:alkylation response protein AidB-like acyl-CoA dehydrogenase
VRRRIFTQEQQDFRESTRGFFEREARPHVERWSADRAVPREFWTAAVTQGLVGLEVPAEYGGAGIQDFRFNVVVNEEACYAGAVGDNIVLQSDVVCPYILHLGTEEQKARWLPPFMAGELMFAIAMTEPDSGSDLRAMSTTAREVDGGYRINGSKTFITAGIQADLVIVAARLKAGADDRGICLFAVEADRAGFSRGRQLEKVGRHAQDTAELFFDDVLIPPENLLGAAGHGLRELKNHLPRERLSIAVTGAATAEAALDLTIDWCRQRRSFGRPIAEHQGVRWQLAEMQTDVDAARVFVDRCIEDFIRGDLSAVDAAKAKLFVTEVEGRVIDRCVQLHGGYGYMEEYPIARLWRDARVQRIYGGTNEIMKDIIGRSLSAGESVRPNRNYAVETA